MAALIKSWRDSDGDVNLSVEVGDLTAFATQQMSGRWTLNFALSNEIAGSDWMDTLTGRGAFATIRTVRPALEALVAEIISRGSEWSICCDRRRAKFYSRYIAMGRIQITA